MNQKEFFDLSKAIMPMLDELTEIVKKQEVDELISITLSADGYVDLSVRDSRIRLSRLNKTYEPEVVYREKLYGEP